MASEYRYRKVVVPEDSLLITISQSGETADTLAALRDSRSKGYIGSLTVCNVPESSLVRESDVSGYNTSVAMPSSSQPSKRHTKNDLHCSMCIFAVYRKNHLKLQHKD